MEKRGAEGGEGVGEGGEEVEGREEMGNVRRWISVRFVLCTFVGVLYIYIVCVCVVCVMCVWCVWYLCVTCGVCVMCGECVCGEYVWCVMFVSVCNKLCMMLWRVAILDQKYFYITRQQKRYTKNPTAITLITCSYSN